MGNNLRARLQQIRDSVPARVNNNPCHEVSRAVSLQAEAPLPGPDWVTLSSLVAKRSIAMTPPPSFSAALRTVPGSLGIILPDFLRYQALRLSLPRPDDLLFFDLETTGLSTGPGTLAFLAAFGRVAEGALKIDQYLLLDYPGESDFLEAVLGEFAPESIVVTYNGKSFDSQLLKIRCLMNGIRPPEYFQADLLHPCRQLWKRVLPSCSQAAIETGILGLDRTGDIPGSMAPDIWFSFLKTGNPTELLGVCSHNAHDIAGLGGILGALCGIAEDPKGTGERFRCDPENLALLWHWAIRRYGENAFGQGTAKTGEELLRAAAESGYRKAAYIVYRTQAILAEWKGRDPESALGFVDAFLALPAIQGSMEDEMFHRRERLMNKLKQKEKRREYPAFDD
ncbi:hypothetical protein AGMMS4952_21280 [Spirochaetia bacterium]|nr:hypothetical protein AGMMS4952_21280 [Spirochaetia bacterium]